MQISIFTDRFRGSALFLSILSILVVTSCGQSGGTGDAALFDSEVWQALELEGCGATIKFPVRYKFESNEQKAYGKDIREVLYSASDGLGQLTVQCGNHPYIVRDIDTLRYVYDHVLMSRFKTPDYENPMSSDVYVDGHLGRTVEFTRGQGKARVRVMELLVGNVRFEVSFGSMSSETGSINERAGKAAKTLFESLRLASKSEPITQGYDESLPFEISGSVRSGRYRNTVLGLSFELPKKWKGTFQNDFETVMKGVHENYPAEGGQFIRTPWHYSKSPMGERPLALIAVSFQRSFIPNPSRQDFAEANRNILIEQNTIEQDVRDETIDGRVVSTLIVSQNVGDEKLKHKLYFFVSGEYLVALAVSYIEDRERKELEAVIKSLTFDSEKK